MAIVEVNESDSKIIQKLLDDYKDESVRGITYDKSIGVVRSVGIPPLSGREILKLFSDYLDFIERKEIACQH